MLNVLLRKSSEFPQKLYKEQKDGEDRRKTLVITLYDWNIIRKFRKRRLDIEVNYELLIYRKQLSISDLNKILDDLVESLEMGELYSHVLEMVDNCREYNRLKKIQNFYKALKFVYPVASLVGYTITYSMVNPPIAFSLLLLAAIAYTEILNEIRKLQSKIVNAAYKITPTRIKIEGKIGESLEESLQKI